MKRIAIVLILLLVGAFAFADVAPKDVLWFWNSRSDQNVQYFRYKTSDEEEWHVVGKEVFSVQYSYADTASHYFEIQQSYDGIHWSESSIKEYRTVREEEKVVEEYKTNDYTVSLGISPFQTFIMLNPYSGDSFYSVYSLGVEAGATRYIGKTVGLGFKLEGSIGFKDMSFTDYEVVADAYLEPAVRLIARKNFDLAVKLGGGVQLEYLNGQLYTTPSACVQVDAAIAVSEKFAVSIGPSASFTYDLKGGSDYTSYIIRAITVGAEWRIK